MARNAVASCRLKNSPMQADRFQARSPEVRAPCRRWHPVRREQQVEATCRATWCPGTPLPGLFPRQTAEARQGKYSRQRARSRMSRNGLRHCQCRQALLDVIFESGWTMMRWKRCITAGSCSDVLLWKGSHTYFNTTFTSFSSEISSAGTACSPVCRLYRSSPIPIAMVLATIAADSQNGAPSPK